jgi:energy-coupling factor transporter ATP-binding protein EcfA2
MNPYLIPGLKDTPFAPLSPLTHGDHHRFYVAVGGSEAEFRRFQAAMHPVRRLTGEGRLVVVTGESGCGKTSLINRCAAWLRDELTKSDLTAVISNLTKSAKPNQPIRLRTEQVIMDVIDDLRAEKHDVRAEEIDILNARIEEIKRIRNFTGREERQNEHIALVGRVYKHIVQVALPDDRVAIILLPPSSDLVSEIIHYADFALHPRIVFFAETDRVDDVQRSWSQIPTNDRMTPILLKVGLLNAGDGWAYAQARQGTNPTGLSFPRVSEETMQRVTEGNSIPIRRLHWLLYNVYKDLASQNISKDSSPLREVTFDHIARCFYRWKFGESGNMS